MFYLGNVGLNKNNRYSSNDHASVPQKMDQMQKRRAAFNEMNYNIYSKQQQFPTNISTAQKINDFTTAIRFSQSFNSYAQSKISTPRRMSFHRNSINLIQAFRQSTDSFSAQKSSKLGGGVRLSSISFSSGKRENNVTHVDQLLDSFRNSPSRKKQLNKFDNSENSKQQNRLSYCTTEISNSQFNENINLSLRDIQINDKSNSKDNTKINFIRPDNSSNAKSRTENSKSNSLQINNTQPIENMYSNSKQKDMNRFLNEIDVNTAFNSQSKSNQFDQSQMQFSNSQYGVKDNQISGFAIFQSTEGPINPSSTFLDEEMITKQSLNLTANNFRYNEQSYLFQNIKQKRNNPFKRFYKTDEKVIENNLYRYIDTQNDFSPNKLNEGVFKRILEKADNQLNKKQKDEQIISQYYNPAKNNMSNLADAEGKVYKKYYALSLQNRIEYLKNQKIQNEAQLMLINYSFINEMEQTNKLIFNEMPDNIAPKFSQVIDSVKQNIYQNAQIQKQLYSNECSAQRSKQSKSSVSYYSDFQSEELNNEDEQISKYIPQDQ